MSDEPDERPFFVNLSDAINVHDSASASESALGIHASDEIKVEDFAVASQPLVQIGGSAIYPTAPPSPPVVIQQKAGSALPDVGLSENMWDLATTGAGITIGGIIGHVPGAIVGGGVCYAWGRVRWHQVQKRRDGS